MNTYMFRIAVDRGWKIDVYFTNTIMSKNDGALIVFTDENGERQNEAPSTVTITTNVDTTTGMSKAIII